MKSYHPLKKNIIYGVIGLIWLIIVLVGYYYTHKPFTPGEMLGLMIALGRVLVVFGIISLAGAIGYKILKGSIDQPVSYTFIQSALGLGLMSVLVLILGTTVGFNLLFIIPILALGSFLLRKSITGWWSSWADLKDAWKRSGRFGRMAAVFGILILTSSFINSFAPPLQFDTLTYHLAIPRSYLLQGHITFLPENMFWGMPEEVEMLYTLVMSLGGNEAATLLGWTLGFLTLMGIFAYTKERFGFNAAWAATACLLVGQTFSASLGWGYVEWSAMLFATAMIIVMDDWLEKMDSRSILLAGIFAGMVLATKYTAGILLLSGLVIILSRFKIFGWKSILKTLLLFGFSAVIVFSPWLIKNALATGNPIYPLLFPSSAMDQIRLDFFQKSSGTRPFIELFLLPWQATVWGVEGKVGYSASIGPLLLGLSLFSGLGWRERTKTEKTAILNVALITGTCLIIWALASQTFGLLNQTRLFFSFFPAWAILSGAGFSAMGKLRVEKIRFGRIVSVLVLLVLSFAAFETGVNADFLKAKDVIFGHRTPDEYVTDHLGWYGPAMQAIQSLPDGSRVLMLWETRSLYCLPICDPDEVIDRWFHDVRTFRNPDRILAYWHEQGYTHLLINLEGENYIRETEPLITKDDWIQLEAVLGELPPPVKFGESYSLFELNLHK